VPNVVDKTDLDTSEPTLFKRPLLVHNSSDDIDDSASFEAPAAS
jgi:hypothetical protein